MELFVARPDNPQDISFIRFVEILVEYGIDFSFDENHELPCIPDNLPEGIKAAVVPRRFADELRKTGLYVMDIDTDKNCTDYNEEHLQQLVGILIQNAGLTKYSSNMRNRLAYRKDDDVLHELAKSLEKRLMNQSLGFGDPTLWHEGRPAFEWYRYSGDQGMLKAIKKSAEGRLMVEYKALRNGTDNIAALRNLVFLYQETKDERYLEPVLYCTKAVYNTWPRIDGVPVHSPTRDRWIWNEICCMYGGTAAYLGQMTDEKYLYSDALKLVYKMNEWCQDADGLYFHAGRPGEHSTTKWARGMGWALLGVLEVLENTPDRTPEFEFMCGILQKAFDGLAAVQSSTGLWRNVLTNPLSLNETSGTCKYISVFARAYWKGWIKGDNILPVLEKAWEGVKCS